MAKDPAHSGQRSTVISIGAARRAVIGWGSLALPLSGLTILASFVLSRGGERSVVEFLIMTTLVVGLGVFSGNSGVLSFGHAAFVALGAYLGGILLMSPADKMSSLPNLPAALTEVQLNLPTALVTTAAIVGVVALPIGLVMVRMSTSAAVIGTFALLVVVNGVLVGAVDFTRGNQTFFGVPPVAGIVPALILALVVIFVARLYRESAYGLRLRASREDMLAARAVGIDVEIERLRAWILSAMLCAAGGVLYGAFIGAFSPKTFYLTLTFQMMAMLLVGGWTTISGAVVGVAVISVLTPLLNTIASGGGPFPQFFGLTQIGLSVAILVVLVARRDGIMGRRELDERLHSWWGKRRPGAPSGLDEVSLAGGIPPVATPREREVGLLVARGLNKSFSGVQVLRDLDVSVASTEILGVIGPNGSGKTTLVNVLSGVVRPDSGDVFLGDRKISALSPAAIARSGVARSFQSIRIFPALSVVHNVQAAALPHQSGLTSDADCMRLLALVGLTDEAWREAKTLSYGAQRRLEIARALATQPRFLLLDEPAAGLNEEESDDLLTLLQRIRHELTIGILVIDHDLRLMLRLCDRIVVIDQGRVIANGPPDDVKKDPQVIKAYLGSSHMHESHSTEGK